METHRNCRWTIAVLTAKNPALVNQPRFSRRTDWPRGENAYAAALKRARAEFGDKLLDLSSANPTTLGLSYDGPTILASLANRAALSYCPEPLGLMSARTAVAAYYARRGLDVSPDRIVLTSSTSEAYGYLFRLLTDPVMRF